MRVADSVGVVFHGLFPGLVCPIVCGADRFLVLWGRGGTEHGVVRYVAWFSVCVPGFAPIFGYATSVG